MRQSHLVREITSQPYRVETGFHRDPATEADVGRGFEWMTDVLEHHYGLRRAKARLVLQEQPGSNGFLIASMRTELGDPFLLLGSATQGRLADCELALRKQLLSQRTATIAVASDGVDHLFLRRRHDSERCEYCRDIERENVDAEQFPLFRKDTPTAGAERLDSVFFEAHSAIRDIDGMHDDEALDELCKLLFTLIALDGTETDSGGPLERFRLRDSVHSLERAAKIRRAYADTAKAHASTAEGDAFSAPLRLSDAALLRVWRLLTSYDLPRLSADLKGRAFQRVLAPAIRAGMGQFFTPPAVIDFVVEVVHPKLGESIIDPFCGSGHFLSRSLDFATSHPAPTPHAAREWARKHIHGIEKSERMIRIARTDLLLHDARFISLHQYDALAPFANFSELRAGAFDVVVTNPPFGSLLGPDAISALGTFELARPRGSTPLEVLGLERSVQFLRPGGRLGIVLPEGIFTNQRLVHLRAWLLSKVRVIAIIALPVETFAPYGANVRTCILFARKRDVGDTRTDYSLVVGGCDDIGYDASGKSTPVPCDLDALSVVVHGAFEAAQESD